MAVTTIKVKTPAKINLTLEVTNTLPNGFHEIKSIMSAINLYDFLTFKITDNNNFDNKIILSGNNTQIPYDKKNLVYKAVDIFCEKTNIKGKVFDIFIEKNIPVEAGLAGGSTNSAGTLYALNKVFNEPLNDFELNELCAQLGSDLNFCLNGGFCLCENRGEKITPLNFIELDVSLIKPKTFGISAKEAYTKFDLMKNKPKIGNTDKLKTLIKQGQFDKNLMINHLETAVIDDYPILKSIKEKTKGMMSGSGPTVFTLTENINSNFDNDFQIIKGLKTIPNGVEIV